MTKRMTPADRKAAILAAAIDAAKKCGYGEFRLVDVAEVAQCSKALVVHYFATMPQMRRAVMREAIRTECLPLIAIGIAMGDKNCRKVSAELRARALQSLGA